MTSDLSSSWSGCNTHTLPPPGLGSNAIRCKLHLRRGCNLFGCTSALTPLGKSTHSPSRGILPNFLPPCCTCSKDILTLAAPDDDGPSSHTHLKLCQGIRRYAGRYLQDHLLLLPKLPTEAKLRELIELKEREARERVEELERQRELLRQQEAAWGAGVATTSKDDDLFEASTVTTDGFETSLKMEVRGGVPGEKKRFEKLRDFQTKVVSFKKDLTGLGGKVSGIQRSNSTSGWMCESTVLGTSVDSQEDPFALQKERLLEYIQQARKANRMDEVYALEASLRDIEVAMKEEQMAGMSYGFTLDQ